MRSPQQQEVSPFQELFAYKLQQAQLDEADRRAMMDRLAMDQSQERFPIELQQMQQGVMAGQQNLAQGAERFPVEMQSLRQVMEGNQQAVAQGAQRFPLEMRTLEQGLTGQQANLDIARAQEGRAAQSEPVLNALRQRLLEAQLSGMPREQDARQMSALAQMMQAMSYGYSPQAQQVGASVMPQYFNQPSTMDMMKSDPRFAPLIDLIQSGKIQLPTK